MNLYDGDYGYKDNETQAVWPNNALGFVLLTRYETKDFHNKADSIQQTAEHYVLSGQQCSAIKWVCYGSQLIDCLRMIRVRCSA